MTKPNLIIYRILPEKKKCFNDLITENMSKIIILLQPNIDYIYLRNATLILFIITIIKFTQYSN